MTPPRPTRTLGARCALAVLAVVAPALAMLGFASTAAAAPQYLAAAPQNVAAVQQNVTVPISGFAFTPADLTVNVGDTVTWVNEDRAPHDVTTTNAPEAFASSTLMQGQSFSYTFAAAGTYSYMCTIHPEMVATVTVVDPAPPPVEPAPAEPPPAEPQPAEVAPPAPAQPAPAPVEAGSGTGASSAPSASAAPGTDPAVTQAAPGATQVVGAAQQGAQQLNPLLLVAAVALGVATLCLLLVTSQPATAQATHSGYAGSGGAPPPPGAVEMTRPQPVVAPPRRPWWPVSPLLLRVLAAAGLVVDGYVHIDLAADYDAVGGVITQGTLFRLQGVVAVLAALLIALVGRRWVYQVVFLVAVSALVPVVLYTYVDVGAWGPLPNMYEPVWYPDKTISAIGEAVAALAAGLLAVGMRSRGSSAATG